MSIENYFNNARQRWATQGMEYVKTKVRTDFLSGQVLKVQTGNLRSRIDTGRLPWTKGFYIGTNVDYGVAWELGFHRPAITIRPRTAKTLRFVIGGKTIFAKQVTLKPKTFPARPFIKPALDASQGFLQDLAGAEILRAANLAQPDRTIHLGPQ